MTQEEEKQLFLKDLCARLPYYTMVLMGDGAIEPLVNVNVDTYICNGLKGLPKPYLRPMSSMTEEEKSEYLDIKKGECDGCVLTGKGDPNTEFMLVDFYNKHHLDYRGLIPMGLALEAPEDMYKTE